MNFTSFFKLVEIQTKVASIIPFLLGTIYALYKFENFNFKETVLFFCAMLVFDMTTTAINNYVDYTKAVKKEGFGYEHHNALGKYNLNPKSVLKTIILMLILAVTLGIVLFLNTDITILIVGVLCFIIGILYSFGPIPISRTPFGEVFSGITMGLLITFIAMYIHIYDQGIITFNISSEIFKVFINMKVVLSLIIISIPTITGIGNIMLANNICDMEEDVANKRYTLPIYIGKEKSLCLFKWNYYIGFIAIIVAMIGQILPLVCIIVLITLKPINNNIKAFTIVQSKKDTFILSVKNFIICNTVYIITIFIGFIIK